MTDIRIRLDHDQVGIIIKCIEMALRDKVRGESLNLVWSILDKMVVRLRKRHAEQRLEYNIILPVYQAIALRHIAKAGQVFINDDRAVNELRLVLFSLDPKLTRFTL